MVRIKISPEQKKQKQREYQRKYYDKVRKYNKVYVANRNQRQKRNITIDIKPINGIVSKIQFSTPENPIYVIL